MALEKTRTVGVPGVYLMEESSIGIQGLVVPGTWKLFYTDGAEEDIKELPIGAAGLALISQGSTGAPVWETRAQTIASGSQALTTEEIADSACAALITVEAPGVLTTDVVDIGYNETPIGKTGYDPTTDELSIRAFPTADNINILVCNRTGAAVNPRSNGSKLEGTQMTSWPYVNGPSPGALSIPRTGLQMLINKDPATGLLLPDSIG